MLRSAKAAVAILMVMVALGLWNAPVYQTEHQQDVIVVWAMGGLGNRLGAVFSGLWLSHIAGIPVAVHWAESPACGAKWDALFVAGELQVTSSPEQPTHDLFNVLVTTTRHSRLHSSKIWAYSESDSRKLSLDASGPFLRWLRSARHAKQPLSILYTIDRLAPGVSLEALRRHIQQRRIKVQPRLVSEALAFVLSHNVTRDMVGIHLRGTDAALPIVMNTVKSEVKALLLKKPHLRLFVCSDEERLEADLAEAFPHHVVYRHKSSVVEKPDAALPFRVRSPSGERLKSNIRRSAGSVQDAMIDMIILGSTRYKRIKGTVVSSFPSAAHLVVELLLD